jgi:uncharacterized protein
VELYTGHCAAAFIFDSNRWGWPHAGTTTRDEELMRPSAHLKFRSAAISGLLVALAMAAVVSARPHQAMTEPARSGSALKTSRPKVRAITAFVRIDRAHYENQIAETLKMLRTAKAGFERAGFVVESVRITTQPFAEYIRGLTREQALAFFHDYDRLAKREGFDANIGPAMLTAQDDPANVELLGEVLCSDSSLSSSVLVAGDDGVYWKTLPAVARMLKYVEAHSLHSQGNFNFAAGAMVKPFGPFYPVSYHTGAGRQFAVALESANVVEEVFASTGYNPEKARAELAAALAEHARAVDSVARAIEKKSGWNYLGLDPTPAPLAGVSIGAAIESFTGGRFGSSGTMTAAAVITSAVRQVPVKQVGYSGLMLPVLEDARLAERWGEGSFNPDSLLAYSAVCATGLDTVPLPGDVSEAQLARILGDMASLAFKWHKPLAARLLPVEGKKSGDRTEFDDPFLTNTTIPPLP